MAYVVTAQTTLAKVIFLTELQMQVTRSSEFKPWIRQNLRKDEPLPYVNTSTSCGPDSRRPAPVMRTKIAFCWNSFSEVTPL